VTEVGLIDAGERAAFHGRPADGIAPLQQVLAGGWVAPAERLRAQWLLGVCLGAAGQFGSAAAALRPLLDLPPSPSAEARHYAGQGACALASIHRQVGRFTDAEAFDVWAGRVAPTDQAIQFNAALGRTADAVGALNRDRALSLLTEAHALCADAPEWWRERVRLGWVQSEVALSWGRPDDAVAALTRSVAESERVGAPRHVAKSLSFLGVSQHAVGDPNALTTLGRGALLAESLGAWPLVWVTRGLLAAWLTASDPQQAERCRRSAEHAVRIMAADLPPELAGTWLQRPDVAPLLGR
jgi:tetratricopeptide (TPR) repeat protein